MQGNSVQGQGGNSSKQGGLSWSQPVGSGSSSTTNKTTETKTTVSKPGTTAKVSSANANKDRSNTSIVGFFIGGLILGGLLAWGWFALRPTTDQVATNTDTQTNTGTQNSGSVDTGTVGTGSTVTQPSTGSTGTVKGVPNAENNTVVIPSPQAAGTSVTISNLNVVVPTWIVVYDNAGGQPGKALGAQLAFPTSKSPFTVSLLRPTVSGKGYIVGQRVDNGDKQYSSANDKLVTDSTGKPYWMQFQVQ